MLTEDEAIERRLLETFSFISKPIRQLKIVNGSGKVVQLRRDSKKQQKIPAEPHRLIFPVPRPPFSVRKSLLY